MDLNEEVMRARRSLPKVWKVRAHVYGSRNNDGTWGVTLYAYGPRNGAGTEVWIGGLHLGSNFTEDEAEAAGKLFEEHPTTTTGECLR